MCHQSAIPATSPAPYPARDPENTFRSTISVHSFNPLIHNGFGDDSALIGQKLPGAPGSYPFAAARQKGMRETQALVIQG